MRVSPNSRGLGDRLTIYSLTFHEWLSVLALGNVLTFLYQLNIIPFLAIPGICVLWTLILFFSNAVEPNFIDSLIFRIIFPMRRLEP